MDGLTERLESVDDGKSILARQANTEVILGAVTGIDIAGRTVLISEHRILYDQL
jgi:NADH dehydrogenase FAD-containing subunit